MTYNPKYSFEVDDNGIAISDGSTILSGSGSPVSITVTSPCYYLRTNGEIWYHTGTGTWTLLINSGGIMPNNIPEFLTDPISPVAGTTWVLHDNQIGSPIGLLLTITSPVNTYKLSYKTISGEVVRTPLV